MNEQHRMGVQCTELAHGGDLTALTGTAVRIQVEFRSFNSARTANDLAEVAQNAECTGEGHPA